MKSILLDPQKTNIIRIIKKYKFNLYVFDIVDVVIFIHMFTQILLVLALKNQPPSTF
jgi:hypothetical protein